MDASRGNGVEVATKTTVEEAARILGIKEESVRKRVRRGKIRSEKAADGRLYVYVDRTEVVRDENGRSSRGLYGDRSGYEPTGAAREVVEAKDEAIRILQHQLQEEREARRRADTIIAQLARLNVALAARLTGLGGLPAESPLAGREVAATVEGGHTTSERPASSWWRKRFGGE